MTIEKAIDTIKHSTIKRTAEALELACSLARMVDDRYPAISACEARNAQHLEEIRTAAFENMLQNSDPWTEEWADLSASWETSSARSFALGILATEVDRPTLSISQ